MFESILRLVVDFLTEFRPVGKENELMHIINIEIISGTDRPVERKKLFVAVIIILIKSKKRIEDNFWECQYSLGLEANKYGFPGLPRDADGSPMKVLPATIRRWQTVDRDSGGMRRIGTGPSSGVIFGWFSIFLMIPFGGMLIAENMRNNLRSQQTGTLTHQRRKNMEIWTWTSIV